MNELPKYKCHKEVRALKIAKVEASCGDRPAGENEETDGGAIITPAEDGFPPFKIDDGYVRKHDPRAGGYYVVYENGYESWSPAKEFEDGYTLMNDNTKQL